MYKEIKMRFFSNFKKLINDIEAEKKNSKSNLSFDL